MRPRLAIVATHPIQYHAPWFRHLSDKLYLKVFYLWDFGVTPKVDRGFKQSIEWDTPLLTGYEFDFVPNVSGNPGTHHVFGLRNPSLLECVKAFNPSAVLLMGYNYETFYRFVWNWKARAPILLRGDSHRIVQRRGLKEHARRQFITKVFKRFAAFLYVGRANVRYFEYHGVPAERLFFAPHAVDNDYFVREGPAAELAAIKWREELGIPANHSVILFAGKFEPKKRPLDLLSAFEKAGLKDTTLLFVGSGEIEANLRARASTSTNVRFAPFQNQSLMPRSYAAADLFVLPSFGPDETWGLAVNEAMCLGRPVIVSDHVGCAADLVRHRSNGLIFRAGDKDALRSCLIEALADRRRLKAWGNLSREIIRNYSYAQSTAGLQAALATLC